MARRSDKPTNKKRNLDAIASDIHDLERRNIFDIGKLLIEAQDTCEHGNWMQWLDDQFEWSNKTAENYMNAFRLKAKFETVSNLKVPVTIIYELAGELDDADLAAKIEALAKASKKKPLSVANAFEVVELTHLRCKWGDYPDATLRALDGVKNTAWAAGAIEQLKQERPDSEEEADKIVFAHHRRHLETLFDGVLPDWLDRGMLDCLDNVEEQHRKKVLVKLQTATQPLDKDRVEDQVFNIIYGGDVQRADQDDEHDDAPEPEPEPKRKSKPSSSTEETSPAEAAAAEATRSDIGALSKAEHERLQTVIDDLTSRNSMLDLANAGLRREIERLEVENKKLKGAEGPTLTINKSTVALIALLKKSSREKGELVVEELCNELQIDPHKLDIKAAA
jgi:Protein of unknown function (DUF3102)